MQVGLNVLERFIESVGDFLQTRAERDLSYVGGCIKLLSNETEVYNLDSKVNAVFFDKLYSLMEALDDKSSEMAGCLLVLQCVSNSENGSFEVRKVRKLCLLLLTHLPTDQESQNPKDWTSDNLAFLKLVLKVLDIYSFEMKVAWHEIPLDKVFKSLVNLFEWRESHPEIAKLAISVLVNLSRANRDNLGRSVLTAMHARSLFKTLLMYNLQEEKYPESQGDEINTHVGPSPLPVCHLLLLLEDSLGTSPPGYLLERKNWAFDIVTSSLEKGNHKQVFQASEFLIDLLSTPSKKALLISCQDFTEKIDKLLVAFCNVKEPEERSETALLKLLRAIIALDDKEIQNTLSDLIPRLIEHCICYWVGADLQHNTTLVRRENMQHAMLLAWQVCLLVKADSKEEELISEMVEELCNLCNQHGLSEEDKKLEYHTTEYVQYLSSMLQLLNELCKLSVPRRYALNFLDLNGFESLLDVLDTIPMTRGKNSVILWDALLLANTLSTHNNAWSEKFSALLYKPYTYHLLAFMLSNRSAADTMKVIAFSPLMPQDCQELVQKALQSMWMGEMTSRTLTTVDMSLRDSMTPRAVDSFYSSSQEVLLNQTISRVNRSLNRSNDSSSDNVQDSSGGVDLLSAMKAYELKLSNMSKEMEDLHQSLQWANRLASRRHEQIKLFESESRIQADVLMKAAEKNRSLQEQSQIAQGRLDELKLKTEEASKELHKENERRLNAKIAAEKEASRLRAELKDVKLKMAILLKEFESQTLQITDLKRDIETHCENLSSQKSEIASLAKEKYALEKKCKISEDNLAKTQKEVAELRRIQEMVAQLTAGKLGSKN